MRITLALLFAFMSLSSYSQQSPFNQKWEAIDSLELKGQVKKALGLVNEIRANSTRDNISYIKASIYRWKFIKIITENAENTILQELNEALLTVNILDNAILNTYKAGLLNDYFEDNQYRNKDRSSGEIKKDDITTWTPSQLVQEITETYRQALKNKQVLLATPIAQATGLLRSSVRMRPFKPSVYDVIAQEAMRFYISPKYGIARPETLFEIDRPVIFENSEDFRSWKFSVQDSVFSSFNAVRLLQEIEEVHQTDTNKTAYIYAQLERLQFAKKQFKGSASEKLYENGLLMLSRKHKNTTISHLIQYYLARYYVDHAPKSFIKDQSTEKLGYYSKARSICKTIIAEVPDSEAGVRAKHLLKEIGLMSLSIKTKKHSLPGVANRVWVQYRNIDSLTIKIVKLNTAPALDNNYRLLEVTEKNKETHDTQKIVSKEVCLLPEAQDANYHTVEYLLPPLDTGHYIIYVDNRHSEELKNYGYAQVEVSDFNYKKTDYEEKVVYQFYDRITGQPLVNLPVRFKGSIGKYNIQGETDALGEFSIKKRLRSQKHNEGKIRVEAHRGNDTLFFADYINTYYPKDIKKQNKAKAKIFIDRGIYRPGQPLYFKGILFQEVKDVLQVTAGEKIQLVIRDPNYKEVFRREYTTNPYGSFSGMFDIPQNLLAGQFTIQILKGKQHSNFWEANDSFQGERTTFRVEQYKRPTFEITFNPVIRAYKPNDSIVLSGNVKAFLGANVTMANGEYTIKRSKLNRYWYYYRGGGNEEHQIDGGTLQTDDKGDFEIKFKANFGEELQDAIMQFTAQLKITDLNGETQSATANLKVSANNLYTTLTDLNQVTGGEEIALEVGNKNLSDVGVSCDNTLKIYKIKGPDRVLFERLWEIPEYQKISETDFVKAFPQEPYATDSIPTRRGELVYEGAFPKQSSYSIAIPTDSKWQSGTYEIEHIAQGKNNTEAVTIKRFTVIQPKNTYLPSDQLFNYEQLNANPKEDGFVALRLKTSLKNLPVFVDGFYDGTRFCAKKVDVNGNETIKIKLDKSYEQQAVIRLKYAQYDRYFSEDVVVDLSEPLAFLQVETQTFRSKLYPDSKERWSFKITNQNNKKAQAEVLVSMYDISLDNFTTSNWSKNLSFRPEYLRGAPRLNSYEKYVEYFRVNLQQQIGGRRVSTFDRFNYFGLSLRRGNYVYKKYLRGLESGEHEEAVYDLKTGKKGLGYAVNMVTSKTLEEPIATLDVATEYESGALENTSEKAKTKKVKFRDIQLRKDLKETAFFYPQLRTNKKGEIKFNFEAPELLTRWKFRLLAHSKALSIALEEKEVVTQKDLSLVPNTPRFLRQGDEVQLSAKIANLTNKVMKGSTQLQLFDATTMQPIDKAMYNTQATQDFVIDAEGNASVFWKLHIPVGTEAITYRMVAKAGKFSDGEENVLPVLPNRMMVTETMPFLVRAGQEKEVQMVRLLENTSTSLEHKQFTFEYTANPSWYALQSLPYLMEFPHECAEQTFSRLYANSLSAKVLNSNPKIKEIFTQWKGDGVLTSALEKNENLKNILIAETPWLRDAQSETERKKRLGLLFDLEKNAFAKAETLKKLRKMQVSSGGFPWFSGGKASGYITRHIVAGFGHMQRLGIDIDASDILKDAIAFLDRDIETALAIYIKQGGKEENFYKNKSHIHFLYARSFFEKEYPLLGKVKDIANKTVAYYNSAWLEKTVYEKGLLALINNRRNNTVIAKTILTGLKESAVQSELNGMYWKDNQLGWYWYQAPIETQALMIEAFDEVVNDQKTVEELKIWLIQQKRTSDWGTTKATAVATYALLMSGTQFLELDDSVRFTMANPEAQNKINTAPRELGTGYLKTIWSEDEVTKDVAQVQVNNTGTTVGYGGLYWQYFEDLDKIEQGEEQVLNLNKKLFLINDQDVTTALEEVTSETVLQLGQTVRVQLTIKTASNMEFIHLKDMRASGLEPIDVLSKHQYRDGVSYYQSTRDVATHFFFDVLPQGTYVIEYDMRVNNKGSFSNGISTVQSMYAPEFSGNTSGMRVTVK